MTPPFRQITNEAFSALVEADPEKAIAYIRSALQAGELEAGQAATQILVFRQANLIRAVVSKNVRVDLLDEVCDGASLKAIEAVLANPPELANLKQLRGWVAIMARRHVASVARDGREQIRREAYSLNYDEDDDHAPIDLETVERGYDMVAYRAIIDNQYELLSDEHRLVVDLRIFLDLPSKEVVAILLSECGWEYKPNNVDQIARRFRDECIDAAKEQ